MPHSPYFGKVKLHKKKQVFLKVLNPILLKITAFAPPEHSDLPSVQLDIKILGKYYGKFYF